MLIFETALVTFMSWELPNVLTDQIPDTYGYLLGVLDPRALLYPRTHFHHLQIESY